LIVDVEEIGKKGKGVKGNVDTEIRSESGEVGFWGRWHDILI
jgi:hypothetical protein